MSFIPSYRDLIGRSAFRQKKTNQQHFRRFQCKRKGSLVSLFSMSSISSDTSDELHCTDKYDSQQQSKFFSINDATSIPSSIFTETFDDTNSDSSSDSEGDFVYQSTLSLTNSDYDSSDDESNSSSHFPDHRPLYSSSSTTVYQFSLDIIEFCRISRLPHSQRIQLLALFRKYIPSPNLVPRTSDDLISKFSM